MVTFMPSPAASYTTVLLWGKPAASVDLLSFNFQVPICTSSARQTAPANSRSTNVNAHVLVFMLPPVRTKLCRSFTAANHSAGKGIVQPGMETTELLYPCGTELEAGQGGAIALAASTLQSRQVRDQKGFTITERKRR